ncbi:MAG: hypothetical protein QXZ31_05615 [Thermofilaceae archaeon]
MRRALRLLTHVVSFEFQVPKRESFSLAPLGDGALTRVGVKALRLGDAVSIVEEAVEGALRERGRSVVAGLEKWRWECSDAEKGRFICSLHFTFQALDERSRDLKGEGEGYASLTCFIEPTPQVKPIHRTFCTVHYVKGRYVEW